MVNYFLHIKGSFAGKLGILVKKYIAELGAPLDFNSEISNSINHEKYGKLAKTDNASRDSSI